MGMGLSKKKMTNEQKEQLIQELIKIDVGDFIKKNKRLIDALADS